MSRRKTKPVDPPVSKPLGTLASDIAARIVQKRPGFPTWFERLPPDLQAALAEVREQFLAGDISSQQRAFAVAVAAEVADRGHPEPGVQAVLTWLRKKR